EEIGSTRSLPLERWEFLASSPGVIENELRGKWPRMVSPSGLTGRAGPSDKRARPLSAGDVFHSVYLSSHNRMPACLRSHILGKHPSQLQPMESHGISVLLR